MAPLIFDIEPILINNGDRNAEYEVTSRLIWEALSTHGLMHIKLPSSILSREKRLAILEAARQLFNLPITDKASVRMSDGIEGGSFMRGYIPAGGESGSRQLEWKEGFAYGWHSSDVSLCMHDNSMTSPLHATNVWPDGLNSDYIALLNEYYRVASQVCWAITQALSLQLINRIGSLVNLEKLCRDGERISLMRLFHYFPSTTSSENDDLIGSSAHTDWGFLTLILQDSIGGLQFHDAQSDPKWVDVLADSEDLAFVVNCGDYLSLLSDGLLKSPLHRVTLPEEQDRYSLVYFYYPQYDSPLPSTLTQHPNNEKQSYSLLKDQSLSSSSTSKQFNSFGEYIIAKWAQVHRTPTSNDTIQN